MAKDLWYSALLTGNMALYDIIRSFTVMHICIYQYPGAMNSAVAGIHELFGIANRFSNALPYTVETITKRNEATAHPEVVIVPPCISHPLPNFDTPAILNDLRFFHAHHSCMVASCAGVFYLAEAGLLEGRTVTTHWALYEELTNRYPAIDAVDRRNMVVDQGDIITAAGLCAYQDLVLHILARLSGYTLAKEVADFALLDLNGRLQSYYARFRPLYEHGDERVLRAQRHAANQPANQLSVKAMSNAAHLGERMFTRRFQKAVNMTPGQYLIRLKIEKAKQLLESGTKSIEKIAETTGYNDLSNFIRAFRRVAGVTPAEFRSRHAK